MLSSDVFAVSEAQAGFRMPSASHWIDGHLTLLWLTPHRASFDSRVRLQSSRLPCSAAKSGADRQALGRGRCLVETCEALRGLIGLRDDLGHCVDLPQRALAEGANREQAVCDLAARTYHLSIAFDDKTETMRIGAGEPLPRGAAAFGHFAGNAY